jgi:hypothetical protein
MKRIFLIITVLVFVFAGCTDKFEEFNTDVKNPSDVPGEVLFSNAQKELADYVNNTNVNVNIFKLMAQYWTETTYIDEANYDLITRNISANIYLRTYLRILKDLDQAALLIEGTTYVNAVEKQNKLQIIELLNVYVYSHLVDVFGAIPYTEALNIEDVYPSYDMGDDVYADLFVRLDAALDNLDASEGSFGSADFYYSGDVASWIAFGNSLKVRMGITIADANSALAQTAIEEAAANVFASNSDDCLMPYTTTAPNYNQLYADLIASGRHDFVPANTIVDVMVPLADPRIPYYFTDMIDTSTVAGVVKMAWVGGTYGYPNSFSQCSHIGSAIEAADFPGIMMTYSEICFYLAEAAERTYSVGGTAESWYNKGIEASFDFWGVSGAAAYLAKPEVAYTTAAGTWRQKIGIQSWLANYTRGNEAYTNWRRLDFPILNLPEEAVVYEDIPVRFTFPVNEQTLNDVNYKAAATALGGDLITTKVFWDVN